MYCCAKCSFSTGIVQKYIAHYRNHRHLPNFRFPCNIDGCINTFSTYNACFVNHWFQAVWWHVMWSTELLHIWILPWFEPGCHRQPSIGLHTSTACTMLRCMHVQGVTCKLHLNRVFAQLTLAFDGLLCNKTSCLLNYGKKLKTSEKNIMHIRCVVAFSLGLRHYVIWKIILKRGSRGVFMPLKHNTFKLTPLYNSKA